MFILRNAWRSILRNKVRNILIAVIMRDGEIIIPEGSSCIQEGDSVIIISRDHPILDVNDIYDEEDGPFLLTGGSDEH